jgi:photosystem II stability/assembly factor-like uncharacterized protein
MNAFRCRTSIWFCFGLAACATTSTGDWGAEWPDAQAPDAQAPDAQGPGASVPDAQASDAQASDAHAPDAQGAGGSGADATAPSSDAQAPDAHSSDDAQPPPPAVLPCDSIADASTGTWDDITPPVGRQPIDRSTGESPQPGEGPDWGSGAVSVHPTNFGVIFAAVPRNGIWQSNDCGATWAKADTGANAAAIDSGNQYWIRIDPVAPNNLYVQDFQGTGVSLFKSSNGGTDWAALFPKGFQAGGYGINLSLDPGDHLHALAIFHANCSAPYNGGCVAETKDGGATWRVVNGPLNQWGEAARAYILDTNTWLHASGNGLFYTSDSGQTWTKVAPGGTDGNLYRSANGTYYLGAQQGIISSPDGHTWTTIPSTPPSTIVIGTGTTLYAGNLSSKGTHVLSSAPEANPKTWTPVTTPNMYLLGGPWQMAYDSKHKLLYMANLHSGLWRSRVE